jgi:5'-deoxynucleotidase
VDPARAALLALYHDAGEVLTGDMPAPVKYFNPEIRTAYRAIETAAGQRLLGMVPETLREEYGPLFVAATADAACWELVHAADKLCAYLKCVEEVAAGNREFSRAEQSLRATVEASALPEVRYFLETFAPSVGLTLDELG